MAMETHSSFLLCLLLLENFALPFFHPMSLSMIVPAASSLDDVTSWHIERRGRETCRGEEGLGACSHKNF